MIYLHIILKRDQDELLKRVYMVQTNNPTDGDYCRLFLEDFKNINVPMDKNVIIAMSEFEYMSYIKKHIRKAALTNLRQIQAPHSKVDYIKYANLKIQPYMISHEFSNKEVTLLTVLRSHTIRNI